MKTTALFIMSACLTAALTVTAVSITLSSEAEARGKKMTSAKASKSGSCGIYFYRKGGTCVDARNKSAKS